MRRIINGLRYDTETADMIVDISGPWGDDRGNFRWNDTKLYRTKRGAWFIAGEGNAMSRWSSFNGNTYGPGSGLDPIPDDEARELLETHGSAALFESHFSSEEA